MIKEIIENSNLETPAYVIDLNQIFYNLKRINKIRTETGAKFYLSLKGFSNNKIIKYFNKYLDGLSSSSLFETKMGRKINTTISTFSVAYSKSTIKEICKKSKFIIFNSINQYNDFYINAIQEKCSIGIRINPEYTELSDEFGANTCKKDSHLGIRKKDMPNIEYFETGKIEGLHMHTMCEQEADTLERTIDFLMKNYAEYLKKIKWINLGGGQLFGKADYDINKAIKAINKLKQKYDIEIIFEPCEGIMINSGYYVTEVRDLMFNTINLAVVDGSAICHMPDSVYRGWTKDLINEAEIIEDENKKYKIVGCSCYAGDTFGTYYLEEKIKIKDKLIFKDASSYTMVKSNMFNGINFPKLYIIHKNNKVKSIKKYKYNCFKKIV